MLDAVAPIDPFHLSNPDVVSDCGLSELPSSIHSDDETDHDAFFIETWMEEVENSNFTMPGKPLFSMRGGEPLDE